MAVPTVLYDEACGFCTRTARRLERRGRVTIAAIGSPLGSELLRDLSREQRYATLHVVDPLGRRLSGGAALPTIARTLRGGAPLATVLAAFPSATDTAYRLVAGHRALVSRLTGL